MSTNIDLNRKLPRPAGHHSQQAFGGEVVDRYDGPNGVVFHAEVRIGDSIVMLGEAQDSGAMPASISIYVETGAGVDAAYQRALAAGATSVSEPANQFYGYRSACVRDSGGNRWTICAVIEELTRAEIDRRMAAMKH